MNKTLLNKIGMKITPLLLAGSLINPLNGQDKDKKIDWPYHFLEGSFIALNIADYKLTNDAIKKGAKEGNPIVKNFVNNKPIFALYKAITTGTLLYASRKLKKKDRTMGYGLLTFGNLIYGYVVHHNLQVNLKMNIK